MKRSALLLIAVFILVGLAGAGLCQNYTRIMILGRVYDGRTLEKDGKLLLPLTDYATYMKFQVSHKGNTWTLATEGPVPEAPSPAGTDTVLYVNGQVVPDALVSDSDMLWVDAVAATKAAGGYCRGIGTGSLDLGVTRKFSPGIVTVAGVNQALLRAGDITTAAQLDEIYGISRTTLETMIGKIPMDVARHWLSQDEWNRKYGGGECGRADCMYSDNSVYGLQISLPYHLSGALALCAMTHELAHCWEFSHGVLQVDPKVQEGFAQWVALKVCTAYECPGVVYEYQGDDTLGPYYQGLMYYQRLERERGIPGVLQDVLHHSRSPQ